MTPRTMPSPAMRLSTRASGILLVLVSACAFGSVALFVQPLYAAGMTALVLLAWRFITAAAVSWGYLLVRARTRRSLRQLTRRRLLVLLSLGALYVGNSFTYIGALEVVPIALNSIIAYLYPAIVAVMALRLVRRLEGRRAYAALALSLLGVALALGGIPPGEAPPLWGLALSFANPVIYATWIVFQARLAGDRPLLRPGPAAGPGAEAGAPRPGAAIELTPVSGELPGAAGELPGPGNERELPGAAGELPGAEADVGLAPDEAEIELPPADAELALASRASTATDIPDPSAAAALMTTATAVVFCGLVVLSGASLSPADIPAEAWVPLLGLGVIATALAIQTFYAGVSRVGGARASIISTIEPVYTIVLAMILFGERLEPLQVIGGALVLVAVVLAETGRSRRAAEPDQRAPDRVSHRVSQEHA